LGIPCKTAAGHAELAVRQRGLSQRHRTLLFLVDGRRTLEEVIELGARAGVPRAYIDELMALGLVVLGAPVGPAPAEAPMAPFGEPIVDLASDTAPHPWDDDDTVGLGEAVTNTQLAEVDAQDADVAEARQLLLIALRAHAPVSGAVTQLRVRWARHREALLALLDEVQARLRRHRDEAELQQLLERVSRLLASS
jgi:hypothetical protein